MMQRRHSASIMGRHQDNTHPPKQVQYWLNWSLSPPARVYAAAACACALSVCVRTCVQNKKSHLISNDEMVKLGQLGAMSKLSFVIQPSF